MVSTRFLRYLAPNVITLSSMIFGLVSLWASAHGKTHLAAWMVVYAVLTDRMDGIVARAVKGTSELGMQLDSFADFLNFGVAPAYLVLSYLSNRPDLPYVHGGTPLALLWIACGAYMLCAVFRLARFNVISDDQVPTKIFFGFPTTLTGGMLASWILVLLKYDPTYPAFGGAKLFGALSTPAGAWTYLPIAVAFGGYLMASSLPMPKGTTSRNKAIHAFLFSSITLGYVCGLLMVYPELIFWMPTAWGLIFLVWGQLSPKARALKPPPLFPTEQAQPKLRAQEDIGEFVPDEPGDSGDRDRDRP